MKNITDEELFESATKGRKKAFDELYRRYEKPLFSFVYRYLKNQELAEEVFHDTFIRIIRGQRPDFKNGRFKGWIYMIARNLCLDKLRRQSLESRQAETETKDFTETIPDHLDKKNLITKVKKLGALLPPPLNELFSLKVSGLSNSEISKVTGVPTGTVKSRTSKMMSLLKEEMNPHE